MIRECLTNAISAIFLLVILSYYWLLLKRHRPEKGAGKFRSITVVMPAHNEERFIAESIASVLAARFPGGKEVIVIDDGSSDATWRIAKGFPVTVLRQRHRGKSASINRALRLATTDLIAIVDADSCIAEDALVEAIPFLAPDDVAVVCATVKVKNRKTLLGMWLHIEQLYNSLIRGLFVKVNVNIVTPGPLSIYKRAALLELNGFETKGFSEDVDIAVRLIKAGYRVEYAARSVAETNMPVSARGFWRQRTRFARGWINILKRHLRLNRTAVEIYTLPLALFSYVQAVVMGTITIVNLVSGYVTYFASKGVYLSWGVLRFLFEWLSVVGLAKWSWSVLTGATPLTIGVAVAVAAGLLTYPLYLVAIVQYDRRIDAWHLVPLLFMFPFWLLLMAVYILMLPECFRRDQFNIWEK